MRGRRREFFAGILSLAAAWVLAPLPALADNSGRPMTFEWGVVYGDQPVGALDLQVLGVPRLDPERCVKVAQLRAEYVWGY